MENEEKIFFNKQKSLFFWTLVTGHSDHFSSISPLTKGVESFTNLLKQGSSVSFLLLPLFDLVLPFTRGLTIGSLLENSSFNALFALQKSSLNKKSVCGQSTDWWPKCWSRLAHWISRDTIAIRKQLRTCVNTVFTSLTSVSMLYQKMIVQFVATISTSQYPFPPFFLSSIQLSSP